MPEETAVEQLVAIINRVAEGDYSNEIMKLTLPEIPEPVRGIAEAMGMMMVKVEAREYELEQMVQELRRLNRMIRENTIGTVSAMATALGARDPYTQGHVNRVADYARDLALALGMPPAEAEFVRLAGILHDVGKIGFPDRLFDDHGQKNPPEVVKQIVKHPEVGAEILSHLDFLGPAVEYVHCHHERLDGSGYPRRLKSDQIPLGARILAIADSYDAMTTDRPYQKGMERDVALGILEGLAKKGRLDEEVLHTFMDMLGKDD